jgi:hypothetical protein
MAKIRFCNLCDRNVAPKKKFNWSIFLVGLLTFGIVSTMYLIYFIVKPADACPMCGNTELLAANTKSKMIQADKSRSQE